MHAKIQTFQFSHFSIREHYAEEHTSIWICDRVLFHDSSLSQPGLVTLSMRQGGGQSEWLLSVEIIYRPGSGCRYGG